MATDPHEPMQSAGSEFRTLAELIPQLVWVSTPEGKTEYANQRWREYLGEGTSAAEGWRATVHPDDRDESLTRWSSALQSGKQYEAEFRMLRTDGTYRWFLARATAVRDADGKILRWFGTCTDIHDQKQAQVSSSFLAEASDVLASSLDYEATLASITRLAVPRFADWAAVDLITSENTIHRVEVAHVDPQKVHLAWDLARKYPPLLTDEVGLAQVLRTGRAEFTPLIPPLDRLITDPELLRILQGLALRSSIVVPMTARGRTLGAITFVTAESRRIYTAADLRTAEDLARRAGVAIDNARLYKESLNVSRMKDEFLSTLSHELRTPMTAIFGWAQMLDSGRYNHESLKKGLSVILRNAKAQSQIIDDLLDMSRIITGKLRLDMQPVDLNDIARAAEDTLRPTSDAKGVRLLVHAWPEPCVVTGDRDRLQQVLWNLLSNAIKFTPRGGIVAVRVEREGEFFRASVRDTGQGISTDFLPHVFERFRQEDSSATRREGGLGLGLAVVRNLVDLHGGEVSVHSDGPGMGATFTVTLPVRPLHVAAPALTPPRPMEPFVPRNGAQVLDGVRVLVVDDQADARELIAEVLRVRGAEVRTAASAAEGLAEFLRRPPHVLVTDIGMPGEDGFSLLYKIRTLGSVVSAYVPAIAVTAYAREEDVHAALRAGFQRHVTKPIDAEDLVHVVAGLAGKTEAALPR